LGQTEPWARVLDKAEPVKASIRAKVEHPFHVTKNPFRHRKVRYAGLAKDKAQLFALANLVIAKRLLMERHGSGTSKTRERPDRRL
jgi:transposase, IS5 family